MAHQIVEKLFEQTFGHTLIKLTDELINTTNKDENQMIVKNIEKIKHILYEMDEYNDFLIQAQQNFDLKYTSYSRLS